MLLASSLGMSMVQKGDFHSNSRLQFHTHNLASWEETKVMGSLLSAGRERSRDRCLAVSSSGWIFWTMFPRAPLRVILQMEYQLFHVTTFLSNISLPCLSLLSSLVFCPLARTFQSHCPQAPGFYNLTGRKLSLSQSDREATEYEINVMREE